jgi:hypothetical protein
LSILLLADPSGPESSVQRSDHAFEPVLIVLLFADQAAAPSGVIDAATGLIPGHGRLVLRDPAVDLQAFMAEHPQVVLGLASIGRFGSRGSDLTNTDDGTVHPDNLTDAADARPENHHPRRPRLSTLGERAAPRHERLAADLSACWVPGGRARLVLDVFTGDDALDETELEPF